MTWLSRQRTSFSLSRLAMQPFASQTLPLVSSMTTTVMVYVLQDVLVNRYVLYVSVAVVSMVLQSYSVQEESGSVEVCAELESGDLQRVQPIVQLTTQSGTALENTLHV